MIEIEIRAKVNDLNEIKRKLNEIGAKFVDNKRQIDRVFGHPNHLDSENKVIEGCFSARIRQVDDDIKLDFKEILRQKGGAEISSKLGNVEAGLKLLEKLGYKEAFIVDKTRDTFSYNGFTICLDNVNKLGFFIEIEKTAKNYEGQDETRNYCIELLKVLSPESEVENRKYGDLMQELINSKKY